MQQSVFDIRLPWWTSRVKLSTYQQQGAADITSCVGGRHNMPPSPETLSFWPWKWCSSHMWRGLPLCQCRLPRPLCSQLKPDVRDRRRQTSDSVIA